MLRRKKKTILDQSLYTDLHQKVSGPIMGLDPNFVEICLLVFVKLSWQINQPTIHPSIHPSIHPTNQPIIQPKGHTSHSSLTYYQLLNRIIAQQIFIVASSKILIEILNDGPAAQCAKLFNAIPFFSHQVHYLVVDYFLFSTEIQYCIPV